MDEFETVAAGEREDVYRFLAGLYLRPPSDSLIEVIRDGSISKVFQGNDEMSAFVKVAVGISNIKDELEAEHASLFVLPSGVLPHEAVYLDRDKRLGGKITMGVRQFYERAGTDISEDCIEMPDHLGMELEFMGLLCKLEQELREGTDSSSLQKCVELQKTFLDEHISRWAYLCCEEVIKHATYGFYKAVAHFTIEFLKNEEEYVSALYEKVCGEGEQLCGTAKN
ncbi:MAG: hypothetical protein EPN22_03900 [Nitrospirae bacterium]|nr:MAG: hypothetical protein EPN22_03900 [Nitrospirota bacterium]